MRRLIDGIGDVGSPIVKDFTADGRLDLVYLSDDPDPGGTGQLVIFQEGRMRGRFGERRVIASLFVPTVPSSVGTLCLGGSLGRFDGARQIRWSGSAGTFALDVDVEALPTPSGLVPVATGDTWFFQAWYRDLSNTGAATSNFTDGIRVNF